MPKNTLQHARLRNLSALAVIASLALTGCSMTSAHDGPAAPIFTAASPTAQPTAQPTAPRASEIPAATDPDTDTDSDTGHGGALSTHSDPAASGNNPPAQQPVGTAAPAADLVEWPDNARVSHLFVHSLVVDPQVAFNAKPDGPGYLDFMVTVKEFKAMLEHLHAEGYVLVSPHHLATVNDSGTMRAKPLMLPRGKKPLVLSVDDMNYYEFMENDGFATKLVLDNGTVTNEYRDPKTGKVTLGDYDVVPILDKFVAQHPDFSHQGAKGILAITGYNGVFGYRTSAYYYKDSNPNFAADTRTATRIAEALKATGWEIASHSWGHINYTDSSLSRIKVDNERWMREVQPIVGKTDLLIYPFGADVSDTTKYTRDNPKFAYLKDQGFNFYFNVDGSTPAWGQLTSNSLRQARFNIDGISLKAAVKGRQVMGKNFFDPRAIIDPARPSSISGTR